MKPIALFYHTCLNLGNPSHGISIIREQIEAMKRAGLIGACKAGFYVGVNGDEHDQEIVRKLVPPNAITFGNPNVEWPGAEVPTLKVLREWALAHPDHYVLYLHVKGLTHTPTSPGFESNRNWRRQMESIVIARWRDCVGHLEQGYDAVGNWWAQQPNGSYWAGNFWWANTSFLATLPEINTEGQIQGGRYEAEVWIGRGPRLPQVVAL